MSSADPEKAPEKKEKKEKKEKSHDVEKKEKKVKKGSRLETVAIDGGAHAGDTSASSKLSNSSSPAKDASSTNKKFPHVSTAALEAALASKRPPPVAPANSATLAHSQSVGDTKKKATTVGRRYTKIISIFGASPNYYYIIILAGIFFVVVYTCIAHIFYFWENVCFCLHRFIL